jgi:hypothetical protein
VKGETSISTYHEYILEAIASILFGMKLHDERSRLGDDNGSDSYGLMRDMYGRYSFIMIANSIEAAANALLLSLKTDRDYYKELEGLNTIFKFRLFCNSMNTTLDMGNARVSFIKDIISCRNEFVHPKPRTVEYTIEEKTGIQTYKIKTTKNRQYPHYHSEITLSHSIQALQDTLSFLAWVCFDVCLLEIQDGCFRLGFNSYGSTGDILYISMKRGIKFDERTFGKSK